MRSFFAHIRKKESRVALALLLVVVGLFGMIIPQVSAEEGYTQGWMGAPDWVLARIDTTYLPDLFIPQKPDGEQEEIPTVSSAIASGNVLLESGSFAEAKNSFEEAIALNVNSFDAWLGRGYALEGLNRSQSAEDSFDKAISLSRNKNRAWAAYAGKGRVLLDLQHYQAAVSAYNSAIERFISLDTGVTDDLINLYIGLAQAEENLGNSAEASDALQKAEDLQKISSSV